MGSLSEVLSGPNETDELVGEGTPTRYCATADGVFYEGTLKWVQLPSETTCPIQVTLCRDCIQWQLLSTKKKLSLKNVLGIRIYEKINFTVAIMEFSMTRSLKSFCKKTLRYREHILSAPNEETFKIWVEACHRAGLVTTHTPPLKALCILNPVSGHGASRKIMQNIVKPVLDKTNITLEVHETQHLGHAQMIVQDCDLKRFGAILCLGGDGLATECLNGMMVQRSRDPGLTVPFALIPTGSDNALSVSAVGIRTCLDAAMAFAKRAGPVECDLLRVVRGFDPVVPGNPRNGTQTPPAECRSPGPLPSSPDASSETQSLQLVEGHSCCGLYYGYMSDVLRLASKMTLRQMFGPARYGLVGFFRVLTLPTFACDVAYQPVPPVDSASGSGALKNVSSETQPAEPASSSSAGESGEWVRERGHFLLVGVMNHCCKNTQYSEKTALAPGVEIDSGDIGLVLVRGRGRVRLLRFLLKLKEGRHAELPFCDVIHVSAVRVLALCPNELSKKDPDNASPSESGAADSSGKVSTSPAKEGFRRRVQRRASIQIRSALKQTKHMLFAHVDKPRDGRTLFGMDGELLPSNEPFYVTVQPSAFVMSGTRSQCK
eukprot:Rmarinus@m.9842